MTRLLFYYTKNMYTRTHARTHTRMHAWMGAWSGAWTGAWTSGCTNIRSHAPHARAHARAHASLGGDVCRVGQNILQGFRTRRNERRPTRWRSLAANWRCRRRVPSRIRKCNVASKVFRVLFGFPCFSTSMFSCLLIHVFSSLPPPTPPSHRTSLPRRPS